MNVRAFIYFWQCTEFFMISLCLILLGVPLSISLATAPFVMLTLRAVIVALVCLTVVIKFQATDLPVKQYAAYWWNEFKTFCSLYFFYQAVPRQRLLKCADASEKHIIFIHGFLCNEGFWFLLKPALQDAGYSFSAVEMPKTFGSITEFTPLIKNEILRLKKQRPCIQITLVAFSMGGLAARNLPKSMQEELNLITLCTPLRGTHSAKLSAFFGAPNGKELSVGSEFLKCLHQREIHFKHFVGVWSAHDTIVVPAINGKPECHGLMLRGRGHLYAALDRKLHRHLIRVLNLFYLGHLTVMSVSNNKDSNSVLKHSMIDSGF